MRTFVLYSRGRTDSKFNVDKLSAAGRMDLICRCVSSALFLSYKKRKNTRIFIILNGPPKPTVTLCFNENSNFYPDERSISYLIKRLLSSNFDKEWKEFNNSMVSRKDFQEVMNEIEGDIYILDEN